MIEKAYYIFWLAIPIILLIVVLGYDDPLYINIHDTYIVFHATQLAILVSLLFGGIGLVYWGIKKSRKRL
ncbi:MAG: hypothetical protein KJN96_11735 [Eudoraea sp.]|nr:hypothetical protein [Eudoraea sp.]